MMLSLRNTLRAVSLLVATIAFAPGCDDGQLEALGLSAEELDNMSEQELDELAHATEFLTSISLTALPALRAPFAGGIFAGITTKDGAHCAVALLPDQGSNLDWPAATKWAEALGATLPTRPVAAMLFANVKDQLRTGWHWTCEQDEDDASCAWYCYFDGGNQNDFRKSYEGSAVAVRLIPLNS